MQGELRIIVCLKQVPDPEAPVSGYRIDTEAKQVKPVGIPPVISPFDENALEAALRLQESHGGKVFAVSVGHKLSKAVLRKALSVGAAEVFSIDDESFAVEKLDGRGTALVLHRSIEKIGQFDLILTGRQASDTNAGVIGFYLAELFDIPAVTLARRIEFENEKVLVERVLPDGHEVVETDAPALVTVSSEAGELRPLRMKEMKEAKNKPLHVWNAGDLEALAFAPAQVTLEALLKPERQRSCCLIEGRSPAEAGENLALRLHEEGVI